MNMKKLTSEKLIDVHYMRNAGISYRAIEKELKEKYNKDKIPSYTNIRNQYIEWLSTGPVISPLLDTSGTSNYPTGPAITDACPSGPIVSDREPHTPPLPQRLSLWQRIKKLLGV